VALHVHGEVALELVALAAGGALEGSVVAVQLLVLVEGARVRKRFAAHAAHVRLLARVAAQVLAQDLGVLEPFAALAARERLFVRVRQFVVAQAAVEAVALAADVAQVPLLWNLQNRDRSVRFSACAVDGE